MTDPIRLNPTQRVENAPRPTGAQPNGAPAGGPSFADTLAQAYGPGSGANGIRFSNHAQKRLETRDINLGEDGLTRLANAVEKAEKRGGRESLVLMDDMAFIVNVRERLVVTAMDTQNRGEGVFTRIDTVVFADSADENK